MCDSFAETDAVVEAAVARLVEEGILPPDKQGVARAVARREARKTVVGLRRSTLLMDNAFSCGQCDEVFETTVDDIVKSAACEAFGEGATRNTGGGAK